MDGGRVDLENRVALLEGALRDVRARLAAVEAGRAAPQAVAMAAASAQAPPPKAREEAEEGAPVANALTLAGRSFLVLGGAFLLRAITEGGRLPVFVGALLGLAYALLWIGAALPGPPRGADP
ncbi:MAG: hypothetical protein PT977_11350, partial [Acidobacteriota bacterium]|nr:hypothetical protein [Acidobacteriota bacterium]